MEEIVTILSTREWAITIWGTGFFIWMLTQSEIRKSLWNVIKILLGKNLRRFFLIIALYVAGITMIFYQLPFWNNIYLKDIILWLIFSGISYCVNSIIKGDTEHLKSTVKDNFKYQMCLGCKASDEQFYELLDYQYYIKQRVLNNLNSDHLLERMLVHMPTGTGKTKTTMHIITNYINFSLKKKGIVIWIAHTTELLQQAYDTFESVWKHLGDGKINAYKLWGNKEIEDIDQSLDGIVFCGLAKIMSIADSNPI